MAVLRVALFKAHGAFVFGRRVDPCRVIIAGKIGVYGRRERPGHEVGNNRPGVCVS